MDQILYSRFQSLYSLDSRETKFRNFSSQNCQPWQAKKFVALLLCSPSRLNLSPLQSQKHTLSSTQLVCPPHSNYFNLHLPKIPTLNLVLSPSVKLEGRSFVEYWHFMLRESYLNALCTIWRTNLIQLVRTLASYLLVNYVVINFSNYAFHCIYTKMAILSLPESLGSSTLIAN
jgi:hypothetical protein